MTWRQAKSIVQLREELDKAYPKRTTPDWTIGDAAHRNRPSDHNPNDNNVVCAVDIREGNIPLKKVAEHVRGLIGKHPAVKYVIYDSKIAGTWTNGKWKDYNGPNKHETHIHVSVGVGRDGKSTGPYDVTQSWKIADIDKDDDKPKPKPKPKWGPWYNGQPGTRKCDEWDRGNDVMYIQRYIGGNKAGPADGYFGKNTVAAVKWYQKMRGIKVDGIVGPVTWRELRK